VQRPLSSFFLDGSYNKRLREPSSFIKGAASGNSRKIPGKTVGGESMEEQKKRKRRKINGGNGNPGYTYTHG